MDAGDNELIKYIKEGDLKAFERVFKDYYALMCSVAMDYVNDSAVCQTLTEDVLLNLWEKKREVVITTSLRAYLLRAVRNKCIDHLRTHRQVSGFLAYIIHSGFISGYQNRYGDNLKPPTNVYHRMTA